MRKRNNSQQSAGALLQPVLAMAAVGFCLLLTDGPLFSVPVACGAVDKSPAVEKIDPMDGRDWSAESMAEQDRFVYQRENRSDPFLPFIKEKVIQQDKQAVEETPMAELFGLQRFEPGQLTLVAIILKQPSPVAMVQDSAGKGYIIEEGMKIGRTGIIEEITANTVIIQQTTTTWNKEKLSRRVEMVLRKEGEKPL